MWYSGRSTDFADGVMPIATGHVGIATSADGLHWTRCAGDAQAGSCLAPSDDDDAFDATHVAVGDVIATTTDGLQMYYFGGGNERPTLGDRTLPRGSAMAIGVAVSTDEGWSWRRLSARPLLAPSATLGQLFVGWPTLLPPDEAAGRPARLFYHAAASDGRFSIGLATMAPAASLCATEQTGRQADPLTGSHWEHHGYVLRASDDEAAFDAGVRGSCTGPSGRAGLGVARCSVLT